MLKLYDKPVLDLTIVFGVVSSFSPLNMVSGLGTLLLGNSFKCEPK